MAEQDTSVAIQNALQKLEFPPNSIHNVESVEKLKSVKSKLQRWGSHLDKFNSISELTEVRDFAYDVEDVMDDAIMVDAAKSAQQRWRMLGNVFMFFSRADISNQQQLVEKQIQEMELRTTSIGRSTGDDNDDEENDADADDRLVVENIPPAKDPFYLSLSAFPAETEILARQLIQIWVAEGSRDRQGMPVMEEQGRELIDWLLEEGFIKEVERGTCGKLKSFQIEKEKLEACKSAAETENFLHVSTGEKGRTGKLEATRLAIHIQSSGVLLTKGNNLRSFAELSEVRSLHIHCQETNHNPPFDFEFLKPWMREFGALRVLDFGGLELESVPDAVGKLARLRYLRLRAPGATKIPASICNLQSLQTIDLKETKRVKTMPVEIWKMKKNLRHLHLGGGGGTALPPPQRSNHYDALENLQTLCGVRPDKVLKRLMVRAKFPNVSRLRLHAGTNKEEFLSFLNSLDHLYHLRSLTLGGPIEDLPLDWNAFPSGLTKMTLSQTLIPADNCVKTLQNLPNLKYLKLMDNSVTGDVMTCIAGGFPALRALRIVGLKNLKCWTVEKGAMRFLRVLEIRECGRLEKIEAFQPSKELRETIRRLKTTPPTVIELHPPDKSNDDE